MIDHPAVTRRDTLIFGVAALTSMLAQGAGRKRPGSAMGSRRSATSNILPDLSNSTMWTRMRRRAARSLISARTYLQSERPDLQFAEQLHPEGRRRPGHGAHFRKLDGSCRGRAGRPVRPCGASGSNLRGWPAYRFLLRPGIKFHDGSPLTAHDVAFSLEILKDKGHPVVRLLLRDFTSPEALTTRP